MTEPVPTSRIVGVFKGGGAKGALYGGALEAVVGRGITFSQVAGSSAGAITAAFIAAGATPDDLCRFEIESRRLLTLPPASACALNLRHHLGILPFQDLREWIAERLGELYASRLRGGHTTSRGPTFGQLRDAGGVPLHIAAADLRWRAPVVFNAELTPDLCVADAAAASSSIPLVFETPSIIGATIGVGRGALLVSDGGVMANLPTFIFSDPGYRLVAGLPPMEAGIPVVAFTFVDDEVPRHTDPAGPVGSAYRARFADSAAATTFSEIRADVRSAHGSRGATLRFRRRKTKHHRARGLVRRASVRIIDALLRVIEVVVLPPLNLLLGWAADSSGSPGIERLAGAPRIRRWLTFADRLFDLAPGYVVAAALLLAPVFVFGLADVFPALWPDWSGLFRGQSVGDSLIRVPLVALYLVLVLLGLLVVALLPVLGLAAFVVGWITKPVAARVGPDLVATFMRNPQEPVWAGEGGRDIVIRIRVPDGWSALRATTRAREMSAALERVRRSVDEQLRRAGLGASAASSTD